MKIENLKDLIASGSSINEPMIWVYKDTGRIICEQYIDALKASTGRSIHYINDYHPTEPDLFQEESRYITVWFTEEVDSSFVGEPYLIVCCHKVNDSEKILSEYITEIPEIEDWQIVDYVKGVLPGVDDASAEWMCKMCSNKFRLMQEVDKIKIFPKETQNSILTDLISGGNFDDLSNYNIFNLTNSIQKKDIKTLKEIMLKIENIDANPLGLNSILYDGFKNIMAIKVSPNSSPQSLGIQPKRYAALKYYVNYFTANQLSYILSLLVNTDQAVKMGDITMDILIDYLITHILV